MMNKETMLECVKELLSSATEREIEMVYGLLLGLRGIK